MGSSVQIIPFYAHPHVHTVINDFSQFDESVRERNPDELPFATCVVTGADQGIDNTFVRLSSLATKQQIFGRGNYNKYGQPSLQADQLFDGNTNVWFCRVLPDNATYANMILVAHFRKGNILDDLNQETGMARLEVKYTWENAVAPLVTNGCTTEADIEEFANSLLSLTPDPQTGYMSVPLLYIRSTGRGRYGNNFSLRINRDNEAEREFNLKMYRFSLIENNNTSRVVNLFTGSLTQETRNQLSTLLDDVIDQFPVGSVPIASKTFVDNFQLIYDFYQRQIVDANEAYILSAGVTPQLDMELRIARSISVSDFDPLFGLRMNTRIGENMPYYRNYTVLPTGPWVNPALVVPNESGPTGQKPLLMSEWNTAFVGARVLMVADPLNEGRRWLYNVVHINMDSADPEIIYDEGREIAIDIDQYDGVNITLQVGHRMFGGNDGDFQQITVEGNTRPPTAAEMKVLLAREQVQAFRGHKDRKILSPARVNLDFIFDANYNMTSDETLPIDRAVFPLFNNSTVLTDSEASTLTALANSNHLGEYLDLNVKGAMYDLNEFRNRNGMTIHNEIGAGCLLHLDCGVIGTKTMGVNAELLGIINMMRDFDGRNTSIDLGYYEIFDPYTAKRITVTTSYYIASNLVRHMMSAGINKPFVYSFATMRSLQQGSTHFGASNTTGTFIRDSFRPDIDLIDWDVKEALFTSRINYWLTVNEGREVQRACQNTRQREASALLEENNVRVLNALKKGLERACRGYLYEWNEPEVRDGFTLAQMEIYRPWIGTLVDNLQIVFTANEWEQNRSIMRCVVYVSFRNIIKRIILEINILRPSEMPVDFEKDDNIRDMNPQGGVK